MEEVRYPDGSSYHCKPSALMPLTHCKNDSLAEDLPSTRTLISLKELCDDPEDASKVFRQKGKHAVLYHKPTDTYRFSSPAHRHAAERRFSGTKPAPRSWW